MYTVPSLCGDSAIIVTCENLGRSGGVTLAQSPPSFVDTCTRPSSDPDISTPCRCADTINENTVAYISAPAVSIVSGPETPNVSGSAYVRSGLIVSQLCPSSVVRKTLLPAVYSTLLSCGENTIGYVHWKRTSAVAPS